MSASFEDWLKEKHPEVGAEEQAKLVEGEANLTDETIKDFDFLGKMSTEKASDVFALLIEEQMAKHPPSKLVVEYVGELGRSLISRRQLIDILSLWIAGRVSRWRRLRIFSQIFVPDWTAGKRLQARTKPADGRRAQTQI